MHGLDETGLARLAEMGIDVYLPRARGGATARAMAGDAAAVPAAAPVSPISPVADATLPPIAPATTVVLIARPTAPKQGSMLDDVERALRFAGVDCRRAAGADESLLGEAAALVLFGDAQVRAVGACLPAQRQREIGWIVTGEPGALGGDAQARRALWSELRRVVRLLGRSGR